MVVVCRNLYLSIWNGGQETVIAVIVNVTLKIAKISEKYRSFI